MAVMADRWVEFRLQAIWPFTVVEVRDDKRQLPRVLMLPGIEPFQPRVMSAASPWLYTFAQETTAVWSPRTGRIPVFLSAGLDLPPIDLADPRCDVDRVNLPCSGSDQLIPNSTG